MCNNYFLKTLIQYKLYVLRHCRTLKDLISEMNITYVVIGYCLIVIIFTNYMPRNQQTRQCSTILVHNYDWLWANTKYYCISKTVISFLGGYVKLKYTDSGGVLWIIQLMTNRKHWTSSTHINTLKSDFLYE